ncbi:hypothetical protein GGTG_13372 [Gaeumannomyces tritici R3-111a-1]|uniref:Uncharacterized protein n=1 Tax=Gaeumannomyces tritici (strain R3-111a-1) TaxID=644352 RepID=J3PIP3_GAET3|nr:hypothetical protein GGTG_13372 [Gaeumannomyces tritici R3-111a-1]EJT69104.1 hypothetical protein GGTG_13372 [Gaeumannomyces tritici R3-111a-1]
MYRDKPGKLKAEVKQVDVTEVVWGGMNKEINRTDSYKKPNPADIQLSGGSLSKGRDKRPAVVEWRVLQAAAPL